MKRNRCGFTLIEVALFLAVTGALFVGVAVGVQNSIFQQRYTDSVQNFTEFLRGIYAGVLNVQNASGNNGRSEYAIYGKLVTFGETYNLVGEEDGKRHIYTYDVIGDVGDPNNGELLKALGELNANVVFDEGDKVVPIGVVDEYTLRWGAELQNTGHMPFVGSLLVVRHPKSGTVYTYVGELIEVNEAIKNENLAKTSNPSAAFDSILGLSGSGQNSYDFLMQDVNFCINPAGSNLRGDVRIISGARNASGIEIVSMDSNNNECMGGV